MTDSAPDDIVVSKVDVDSRDPNIRGFTGSVMAAGTAGDHEEFTENLKTGMSYGDAVQVMAVAIARRSQRAIDTSSGAVEKTRVAAQTASDYVSRVSRRVVGPLSGVKVKTLTLMCKMTVCDEVLNTPRDVITKPDVTWMYSQLSIDGGASPLHYWRGPYALMEDFWTQDDLDRYAFWHGASYVVSLELEADDADSLMADVRSNSIDRSPTKSMLDGA